MESWIILSKLTIIFYCALKLGAYMTNITSVILVLLIYIIINMSYHIIRINRLKNSLLVLSIAFVAGCFYYMNPLFILLLPMNLIEITFKYNKKVWVLVVVLTLSTFVVANDTIMAEYALLCSFSCIIYILTNKTHKRFAALTSDLDTLREKNYSLHEKLSKDAEYEKQVKYSSQLEERNKLSQEIHDKVGHSISGSLMQLEAAKLLIEYDHNEANNAKVRDILQNVINILRDGMENIRATLRNIKPASEQLGINRLKLLLEEFSVNSKIKSNLLHKGNLELVSYVQWKIIYENIKEALTNTIKYSNASSVTVNIEVLNKFIKAEIKDNGVGASKIKKGLGITGMEERSESISGKVIADGSRGFSIITLLPIGGDKNAD